MIVHLDQNELKMCHDIAELRLATHIDNNNYIDKVKNNTMSPLEIDYCGCIGEYAVAKLLKLEWTGKFKDFEEWKKTRKHLSDVSGYEVRYARNTFGDLVIYKKDNPDKIFISVNGLSKSMVKVSGWIHGSDGKKEHYLHQRKCIYPCYYIPISHLNPIITTKELFNALLQTYSEEQRARWLRDAYDIG